MQTKTAKIHKASHGLDTQENKMLLLYARRQHSGFALIDPLGPSIEKSSSDLHLRLANKSASVLVQRCL